MARAVYVNEAIASRRRLYFQIVDVLDGMTAELGEAGGQPQVSIDGAAWSSVGVGVLVSIGNGRYYSELAASLFTTIGTIIESRYKSAFTAECPGDSLFVEPRPVSGAGAIEFTYTITSTLDALPVPNVEVWVSTDIAGTNVVAGTLTTNAFGQVVFYLDAGTHYFWRSKFGWNAINPDVEVVS